MFLYHILLVIFTFVRIVKTQTTIGVWHIPSTFSFSETSQFSWPVTKGTDLISLSVISSADLRVSEILPLAQCLRPGSNNSCNAYENTGNSTFGGYYATDLSPGATYFFQFVLTSDGPSQELVVNSTTFTMAYPSDPAPPSLSSSQLTASSTLSESAMITTARFLPGTTVTNHSTSTTPRPTGSPITTEAAARNSLSNGARAGIACGVIGGSFLIAAGSYFLYRRYADARAAKVPPSNSPINSTPFDDYKPSKGVLMTDPSPPPGKSIEIPKSRPVEVELDGKIVAELE